MKKSIDSFINFILIVLSIMIVIVTIYFCIDVFGIVEVPQQYSIANLFYSQIEVIAAGESISSIDDNTIPDNTTRRIVVDGSNGSEDARELTGEELLEKLRSYEKEKPENDNNQINVDRDDSKTLYYSQLDKYGKTIYDKLYLNKDKLKTGTYTADFDKEFNDLLHEEGGTERLNNSFQLAINALTFDNPELFYVDVTKMYLLTEITTRAFSKTYKVSIGGNGRSYLFDEFTNKDSLNEAISQVEGIKNKLVEDSLNKTNIEKLRMVHDYLIENTEYDALAGNNIYNIYGALIDGRCVCEGYARSYKYILDEMRVPCVIACGIGTNSVGNTESHAWNYVLVDGIWYAVDTTWDDPVITGGGTIRMQNRDTYFLKGSDTFFKDHFEDGNIVGDYNFKYPTISVTDY